MTASNQIKLWKQTVGKCRENTLEKIASAVLHVRRNIPLLLLHWFNILGILDDCESSEWLQNLYNEQKFDKTKTEMQWTEEIVQKGIQLVYCGILADYFKVRFSLFL